MTEKRVVQIFFDLVKIDSPSGHEENVLEYIEAYCKKLSLNTQRDSYGNLIVKKEGVGEPLLLCSHADTVEPGKNIQPRIENGIIKSDGTTILGADNKSSIAAILEAVKQLVEEKKHHRPLELVFTKSEEVASWGAVYLDYKQLQAKEGYTIDNANPVGTIVYASPFYYRFDITVFGKDAHASRPHEGIHALKIAASAIHKIKLGKIDTNTLANIGMIQSGHVRNTIPGSVVLMGEVRSYSDEKAQRYLNKIIDTFRKTAEKTGGSITYETLKENAGYIYKTNDPFVKKTMQIMKKIGVETNLIKTLGCADANVIQEHGIKMLDLGDGSRRAHTLKESIPVAQLQRVVELVLALAGA